MKLFLKKLVLLAMVLALSTGRSFVEISKVSAYTGDVFDLHIDTNGSNNQGGGLGIYECHYLDTAVSLVNSQEWDLTEGVNAQAIVDYFSAHYTCEGHNPIVPEVVAGKWFTGFVVYHVTYWSDGRLKFVGIQASYSDTEPNVAPVADNQSVSTPEDTAKAITLTGSDGNAADVLSYLIVSQPTHGTLSGSGANVTYTPAANYNGPDSFTFKINDGKVDSNIATVSITVGPVNDAPVADDQSVTTAEDTGKDITLTGSDTENDPLTYLIVSLPTHGTLTGTGADRHYVPDANYNGPDSFTFKVNDGTDDSNVATVSITVTSVNDAPVADDQSVTTTEDTGKDITLTGSDIDGDALTYILVSGPTHGTLTGTGANRHYEPDANYNGPDSFTFKVNDGTVDSNVATVSITVGPENDAPTADDQSVTTAEDTGKDITLTGSDAENDPLTYLIVSLPAHGTLTGTGADRHYVPDANYFGPDSFTFKVNDGTDDSNVATVSITVTSVNDAPVADDQSVTTAEDTGKDITLTGSDIDGDALTYILVSGPTHGTLTGTGASRHYEPDANYNGPDSFTFKVNDGKVDSNVATVLITVGPENDAPVANDQSVTTAEDTGKDITLTGSDAENDPLTYLIVSLPAHGTLTGTGADRHYVPDANYFGPDSFTFKVNDGNADSNVATVTITVTSVNDSPVANDQSVTTPEDTAKDIILAGSDIEGDDLDYIIVAQPLHGTVVFSVDHWVYTPDADYFGPDSFTFKVNDGSLDSNVATVSITVTPVNDAPVANDQSVTTPEDTGKDITLTGSDIDGDALSFIIVSGPEHGILTGTGADRHYEPNANYFGPDSFTFKVNDGNADSITATVTITVTSVNDAPVADDQSVTTAEDTGKDITLTGSDIDGDALTYILVSGPTHGTLTGTGASRHYEPDANYNGPDSFTFKVNDGTVDSNIATVSITVTPVNDAPIAQDSSFTVDEGGVYNGFVSATDTDVLFLPVDFMPFPLMLNYTLVSGPVHGVLEFNPDGSYKYTHDGSETLTDSFTFKANDGELDSNIATVSITINPINDLPVANDSAFTLLSGAVHDGFVTGSDVDSANLTYEVVANPVHGALTFNADGTYSYDHDGTSVLPDSFTFWVYDGEGYSNVATVSITVTPLPPVNVAPVTLPEAFTIPEGGTEVGAVAGIDADGDPITFVLVDTVTNGTLTFAANGAYTYVHNGTETTTDTFRFRAFDGRAYSAIRTAYITITPVNDAPVAVNGSDETDFETALTGNIHDLVSDVDSADWTVAVVANVTHGTLVLNSNGTFTYTPNTGYSGTDQFTFKANDGSLDSNLATFTITVNEEVIIVNPETPLSPLSFWWAYLLGLLLLLLFFLRPNLKYALVDKDGNQKTIRRHIFAKKDEDLFVDLNDKNVQGLVAVDLVVYKQLVKKERGQKITFNLFKKPVKEIVVPDDKKDKIETYIKL